jgi:DNA-binding CsgD family transcriptional regulator
MGSRDALERIQGLWDELADFGAHETEAALLHSLRATSGLIDAQQAFWAGTVRLVTDGDPLGGWRLGALRRLHESEQDRQVLKQAQQYHEKRIVDPITAAQARLAGTWRAHLLREIAPPGFETTTAYDILYRSRKIHDAIFTGFPVNADAESIFGWYRVGGIRRPFLPEDRDVVSAVLRPLRWFHRQVMLAHGLLVAEAPLTGVERRLMSCLLTERSEKEIASELSLTPATTHTYITALFRKFGVSGRPGLTALWLGRSPAHGATDSPSD